MGITGLLPFLEKSSRRTNIDQFAGKTVAIDSYCWLHKGAFSCADKLLMGQQSDAYVRYCMRFIEMLLSHRIKPILVFDGRHLPAKAATEAKRREARQINRKRAADLMRSGQHSEGRNLLRRSIDITHEMALELIKRCQEINVDCIVAPYEADAQLAYLNISGIADVIITEDSDLTLFGCKKVFFKMDMYGNGLLVDQEKIHLAMGWKSEHFDMDKFLYMCILSGCDYLQSLPGIGLAKAKKFIIANNDCDIYRALTRLGSHLNMKSLAVTKEYRDAFMLAVITFKHQLVFCPLRRKQVRLNPPTPDITAEQLHYAGDETNPDIALQLALGNCDPFTQEMLHDFNPDAPQTQRSRRNTWNKCSISLKHISIWSKNYTINEQQPEISPRKLASWPDTAGQQMVLQTTKLKRTILSTKVDNSEFESLNEEKILEEYENTDVKKAENNLKLNISNDAELLASPKVIRRANPFSNESLNKTSPSLVSRTKSRLIARNIMKVRRTVIDENVVTESKFFSKSVQENKEEDEEKAEKNNTASDEDVLNNSTEDLFENTDKQFNRDIKTEEDHESMLVNVESGVDLRLIDIGEKTHDASFSDAGCNEDKNSGKGSSQEIPLSRESGYSDTSSNCDLGRSQLDTDILSCETDSAACDVDSDFLIEREDISAVRSSLFKWSNTKLTAQTNKLKHNKTREALRLRSSPTSKLNITNGTRRNRQLSQEERQQSLLSMFGFQKKSNIKL